MVSLCHVSVHWSFLSLAGHTCHSGCARLKIGHQLGEKGGSETRERLGEAGSERTTLLREKDSIRESKPELVHTRLVRETGAR